VIFDPSVEGVITAAEQVQDVDYTPFEGIRIKGAVKTVLSGGAIVVSDGKWVGKEGQGRYLKRKRFKA
jgi:dihydropyrimidinase